MQQDMEREELEYEVTHKHTHAPFLAFYFLYLLLFHSHFISLLPSRAHFPAPALPLSINEDIFLLHCHRSLLTAQLKACLSPAQ